MCFDLFKERHGSLHLQNAARKARDTGIWKTEVKGAIYSSKSKIYVTLSLPDHAGFHRDLAWIPFSSSRFTCTVTISKRKNKQTKKTKNK